METQLGSLATKPFVKKYLENVQRRSTKLLASLRDLTYPERLAKLKLPSLEHRRKRGDVIEM